MHHVAPQLRADLLRRLEALLGSGGRLCIFEHNPFNPITQRLVSACSFDKEATLLRSSEICKFIQANTGLRVTERGYTLFFPNFLKFLRPLERYLEWLPLGGQYYVIGTKP